MHNKKFLFSLGIFTFLFLSILYPKSGVTAATGVGPKSVPQFIGPPVPVVTAIINPSVIPIPSNVILPPEPKLKQKGIVVLSAFTINRRDNNRKFPFQGTFSICRTSSIRPDPIPLNNEANMIPYPIEPPIYACTLVQTSNGGHAMVKLSPGNYTVRSPGPFCPPGMRCLMNETQAIMPGFNFWKIEPASFWLPPAQVVHVTATQEWPVMILSGTGK